MENIINTNKKVKSNPKYIYSTDSKPIDPPHLDSSLEIKITFIMSSDNYNNNNPYLRLTPLPASGIRSWGEICEMLNRCGKRFEDATRKAECLADNVWHHLRISPRLSDAAMAKIAQGTKVFTEGGYEKVFQQEFHKLAGEKLLKAYACYVSTSSGPVIGTLYISTQRMAFCSDYPLSHYSSSGQQEWVYFKVVMDLDQLRTVNPSANRWNPSEKFIHVVTRDGYEFWFMGFISYDKALKTLTEALRRFPDTSGGLVPV